MPELSLKLPPLRAERPLISDARECKNWLAGLTLTNIQHAHREISNLLNSLNEVEVPSLERLKMVELLREPVAFLQAEIAKKFVGKPLPLHAIELALWTSVSSLWASVLLAYQRCLDACLRGDATVLSFMPIITQRCLRYTGLHIREYYRAYRELPQGSWGALHELYAFAEDGNFADKPVRDSLNLQADYATCAATYAQVLLTQLANPYQLSARQLVQMDRWLDRWALRIPVAEHRPVATAAQCLVNIDLDDAEHGVQKGDIKGLRKHRYLDTERLSLVLKKRIAYLAKGGAPSSAGLGEDCVQPNCEAFLALLHHRWCEADPARASARDDAQLMAELALGFPALHFYVSGERPFEQPDKSEALTKDELNQLRLFGHVRSERRQKSASELGFAIEPWRIENRSEHGFGLKRVGDQGMRIMHDQLLGLQLPETGTEFRFAFVRWLTFGRDAGLRVGAKLLPGVPFAVAVRPISINPSDSHKYTQAFVLGKDDTEAAQALVLPVGWFLPGRRIEVYSEKPFTVKLLHLLDKGSDFERVSFSVV